MNERMFAVLAMTLGPLRDSNEDEGARHVEIISGGYRFSTDDPRWFDVGIVTFSVTVPMDLRGGSRVVVSERGGGVFHSLSDLSIRRYMMHWPITDRSLDFLSIVSLGVCAGFQKFKDFMKVQI